MTKEHFFLLSSPASTKKNRFLFFSRISPVKLSKTLRSSLLMANPKIKPLSKPKNSESYYFSHCRPSKIRNVSVQRNMGGEAGIGKYLLFNDADNRLPKHFLEGIKYHLGVKPIDMFTTWCIPDSKKSSDKAITTYLNLLAETGFLLGNPGALGAMIGCRRKIFGKIGGFNPEVGFAEDTNSFVRDIAKIILFPSFTNLVMFTP